MRHLISLLFSVSLFGQAVYAPVPTTTYTALSAILNAKSNWTSQSGAASGACTTGLDWNVDTASLNVSNCASSAWNLFGVLLPGGGPAKCSGGTGACIVLGEGTSPSANCPASGVDCLVANSTSHAILASFNNGPLLPLSQGGIADTTITVSSGSMAANICSSSATTVTMTGLTTSMVINAGYSADPSALTGWGSTGGMTFKIWPSAANTASWKLCNQTGSSISYSAITFNVGAQ